jgi:hypothetical protein
MVKHSYFPMELLTGLNFVMLAVIFIIIVMATVAIINLVQTLNIDGMMNSFGTMSQTMSDLGPILSKVDIMSEQVTEMNAKIDMFIESY